jgi:hypothetical protein
LINKIWLAVRLSLILPAIITLSISATIFNIRQTEKMTNLSESECVAAKAVALINQNNSTLGLSVLMKKPDNAIFVKSDLLKR